MSTDLHQLVAALHQAVDMAGQQLRQRRMELLSEYFQEDGKPICVDLQLPKLSVVDGSLEYVPVKVPRLTLVPLGMLSLSGADIDFWVKLEGLESEANGPGSVRVDMMSKPKDEREGIHVQLHFSGDDPPEALMKVNDTLTRIVP